MSGSDSVAEQPPEGRVPNRDRRPVVRRTPRAGFPLITVAQTPEERREVAFEGGLDTSDPSAGGGRSFRYSWEEADEQLKEQIATVAAGGVISYVHRQVVPAASWVIDHHMGLIPNVVLLDSTGQQMIAEVRHPSDQTTVVVHSAPYTGTAYLRP